MPGESMTMPPCWTRDAIAGRCCCLGAALGTRKAEAAVVVVVGGWGVVCVYWVPDGLGRVPTSSIDPFPLTQNQSMDYGRTVQF